MSARSLLLQAGEAVDDGLSLNDILASLPTDPASLVALAFGIGFVAFVLYYGVRERKPGPDERKPGG